MKSAGELLTSEIRNAVNSLIDCITPIFDVNEKGQAKLLGSGVLLSVSGEAYLCTAKHVIDGNKDSTLYIDGPKQLETLEGDFHTSSDHDIAVLKLTPNLVSALEKYSPLPTSNIASEDQIADCKYAEFIGFPESKNRKIHQQNKLRNQRFSFGCIVAAVNATSIRLRFNKKRNVEAQTRLRVTSPDLYGVSGGAMFGVSIDTAAIAGNPEPRLIGISTDWLKLSNEVAGTSIALVLAIIRDAWNVQMPQEIDPRHIRTNFSKDLRE